MACAATLSALFILLGDPTFPLEWHETTMDDGKPMVFSLAERDGALFARFVKTGDGLWAEGSVAICARDGALEARMAPGTVQVGPAAGWMVRKVMSHGARISMQRVDVRLLRVGTVGWKASFTSRAP